MSKIVQEWNAQDLIAEISGRVLAGMDRACQFAAGEAQANAPELTGLLKSKVDYEVRPEGNEIVGYVGVIGEKNRGKAFYGYFQELGTVHHAAHPFLRPAVFDHPAEIVRLIAGGK